MILVVENLWEGLFNAQVSETSMFVIINEWSGGAKWTYE